MNSPHCAYSVKLSKKLQSLDVGNTLDLDLVHTAIHWAKKYHDGQFRKSGEPFYTHVLAVTYLVADHNLKTEVIVASILHDIIEDTEVTIGMVLDNFGWRIAEIVDRLTRDRPDGTRLSVEEVLDQACERHDTEVILIKLFDRLHNISTMRFLPREKQKKKVAETIENFLILAEELSLTQVSEFLYTECLKLNIKLGVVAEADVKKRQSVFEEEPILPFPAYQNN